MKVVILGATWRVRLGYAPLIFEKNKNNRKHKELLYF